MGGGGPTSLPMASRTVGGGKPNTKTVFDPIAKRSKWPQADRVHVNGGRINDPSRNGHGPDISLEKCAEEVDIALWTVTWYAYLQL